MSRCRVLLGHFSISLALSVGCFAMPPDPSKVHRMIDDGFVYDDHTAVEKVEALYKELSRDAYLQADCPSVIAGVFPFVRAAWNSYRTRGLRTTLVRKGPEYGAEAPKFKLFHTYGIAAQIDFIPTAVAADAHLYSERFINYVSNQVALGASRYEAIRS